jgi:hypothetical protein
MADGISFFNNVDVETHIKTVMLQTNYTEAEAREKLQLFNGDYMSVLKDYMGISAPQKHKIKSVNQEIYRQIRHELSTEEYRKKNPINMDQVISNFQEAEEKNLKLNK